MDLKHSTKNFRFPGEEWNAQTNRRGIKSFVRRQQFGVISQGNLEPNLQVRNSNHNQCRKDWDHLPSKNWWTFHQYWYSSIGIIARGEQFHFSKECPNQRNLNYWWGNTWIFAFQKILIEYCTAEKWLIHKHWR